MDEVWIMKVNFAYTGVMIQYLMLYLNLSYAPLLFAVTVDVHKHLSPQILWKHFKSG